MMSYLKKTYTFFLILGLTGWFSNTCAIENLQENQQIKTEFVENINTEKIMTLEECIQTALDNSPILKRSKYNYDIAKNAVSIAKSEYFPTIGAGTGYNYSVSKNNKTSTNSSTYDVETSLNQLIWNFGRSNANIRMQKFNRITALYNYDNAVLDTIYDVKTKYFGVLAAKANVDVAQANVEINERNYYRIKAYFEEGIKSKIDLVNAEVYLTDAKASLVNTQKTYKNTLVALNNSMYLAYNPVLNFANTDNFSQYTPQIPVELVEKPFQRDISANPDDIDNAFLISKVEKINIITNYKFQQFPYSLEECYEMANSNRPDLKAYNSTLEAIKEQLLYTKREYYPSLTGNVGYGYRNSMNTNSLSAGVNLSTSVNIFKTKKDIDNAKIQVDIAQNELDLAKQNVYFEVQNAYINMIELEKQIPLQAAKVSQTLENLELADGRYAVGLGDYIELQDAKMNYNTAQHTFVQTVFNYNVARANLEKAIAIEQKITKKIEDKK